MAERKSMTPFKIALQGAGPVAEWLSSRAPLQAAQCFVGSSPGRGHGTAHQATLRRRPACHGWRDPQRRVYNCVLGGDRKSTRLNSSHANISYAVFCLKKKNIT